MSGQLADCPAEVIVQLLIDLELAIDPDLDPGTGVPASEWLVTAHKEQDPPDRTITVYDTEGVLHGAKQVDGEYTEYYGVQVRVRSISPREGKARLGEIRNAFDKLVHNRVVNLNDVRYMIYSIDRTSTFLNMSKGEAPTSDRTVMTVNFLVSMRQID